MMLRGTLLLNTIEPPRVTYPADGSVLPCNRYRWRPIELPPVELQQELLSGKKVLIIGGTEATAEALAQHLGKLGMQTYRYNAEADQEQEILLALQQRIGALDGILDLGVEARFSLEQGKVWEGAFGRTVHVVQAFYEEWAEETKAQRLFYVAVTYLGGKMGYDESPEMQPLGGIWAGFAKSLPREIANCHVKVVDLGASDKAQIGPIIARELYNWGVFEVGYQNGVRFGLFAEHAPLGEPVRSLTVGDTVLISGGARGIGFALTKELATNFGCRVVVTGRSSLPSSSEAWLQLDAEGFKAYQFERLRTLAAGEKVSAVRKELERLKSQRDLYRNIEQLKSQGLAVDYVACDFNDLAQVQALVEEIGPSLRGVIHNAGIEETVRLNKKSVADCLATVRIKVDGFLHLLAAVSGHDLAFFCNVGSLSGRWGGMVGQLDYAGGNEGLTRLGFWATANGLRDVQTICWPTWDKLGLITNYQAALKYASAIHVEEGIYHWQRNLLAGESGECIYMGKVGKALVPMQINGFLPISIIEAPDIDRIHSQVFYLGVVREFRLFHSVTSVSQIGRNLTTAVEDVRFQGLPMFPVSLLLEYAISLCDWVVPEGWQDLPLSSIEGLEVDLQSLTFADGEDGWELEKHAVGSWQEGAWVVSITLNRRTETGSRRVARCSLVHREQSEPSLPDQISGRDELQILHGHSSQVLEAPCVWNGAVFDLACWNEGQDGTQIGRVSAVSSGQIWNVPHVPSMRLPSSHLENIFRAAYLEQVAGLPEVSVEMLSVQRMDLLNELEPYTSIAPIAGGRWQVQDAQGQCGLIVEGISYAGGRSS